MGDWRKRFLKSKAWSQMRASILLRDRYICQKCHEIVTDTPEVHHLIELDENNVNDPTISLNPELLVTLHHACHDQVHGRFGGRSDDVCIVNDDLSIDYSARG